MSFPHLFIFLEYNVLYSYRKQWSLFVIFKNIPVLDFSMKKWVFDLLYSKSNWR
jgi:hypothetical protein